MAKKKTTKKPDPVHEKAAAVLAAIRAKSLEVQVGQKVCRELAEAMGQQFTVQG